MKNYMFIIIILLLTACNTRKTEDDHKAFEIEEVAKLPYFNSSSFTPNWEKATHKIPAFSFTNQNGKTITNDSYKGKVYIADFFFTTCPGICPKLTNNMKILQKAYASDDAIMLLSHTVMPWVDDVDKLKKYALENEIQDQKWNLVTGNKEELYNIARNGYFADEDFIKTQDVDSFIHTENFILVDQNGFIRGVYNGTIELDVKRLMRHITILKNEHI